MLSAREMNDEWLGEVSDGRLRPTIGKAGYEMGFADQVPTARVAFNCILLQNPWALFQHPSGTPFTCF